MFTNDYAKRSQVNAWKYLSALFPVRMNFLRASSAGGALACYTYANELMPYIRGLYLVNGLYDLEWLLAEDPANEASMLQVYDNDRAEFRASNPARIPASSWAGANVKVLVSDSAHPDTSVDPSANGLALIRKITSVADDAVVGYHQLGHGTPGSSHKDMIASFERWSRLYD